jgi:hypothetical protein
MVERHHRDDSANQEAVHQPCIIVEPGLIELASSGGQYAWPGNRKPIRPQTKAGN